MAIFPLAPDQIIAQMTWSNGVWGGTKSADTRLMLTLTMVLSMRHKATVEIPVNRR